MESLRLRVEESEIEDDMLQEWHLEVRRRGRSTSSRELSGVNETEQDVKWWESHGLEAVRGLGTAVEGRNLETRQTSLGRRGSLTRRRREEKREQKPAIQCMKGQFDGDGEMSARAISVGDEMEEIK